MILYATLLISLVIVFGLRLGNQYGVFTMFLIALAIACGLIYGFFGVMMQ